MSKLKMVPGDGCAGCVFENKRMDENNFDSTCDSWNCLARYNKGVGQIVVLDDAAARSTDPDTSHKAAAAVAAKRYSIKDHILMELAIHGGGTGKEIANRCAIPLNSITPRFKELTESNQIKDSGERRDRQIVWVLA